MKLFNLYGNMPKDNWVAENTFSCIRDFIRKSDRVLDLGSGNGLVADLIYKNITRDIKCVDVIDINKSPVPSTIYDGEHIPFGGAEFDVVLCNFVLHHTPRQEVLIDEMKRVTGGRIIILEDTPENIIDTIFKWIHIFNSRRKYGSRGMRFRSNDGWKIFFAGRGLKLEKDIAIGKDRDPMYPINRRVYVLKK
jgi:ubiquinone/menaquinone biosynthesis C-methylase UbiE